MYQKKRFSYHFHFKRPKYCGSCIFYLTSGILTRFALLEIQLVLGGLGEVHNNSRAGGFTGSSLSIPTR
ncbi:hypothetical protein Hanom_Chr10g00959271 [Helianthus anomalus]